MTTPHQRQRFAHARGAKRFQVQFDGQWITLDAPPSWRPDETYRTHPDDAHLEYGPLSGALREWVAMSETGIESPRRGQRELVEAARDFAVEFLGPASNALAGESRNETILRWAELLADEGM